MRRGVIAFLISVMLVPFGLAQTISPSKAEKPAIVANTDEVTLDIVVRDKKNRPVLDLHPQDIAVSDNGAPVKLSDLRLVRGGSGSDHLLTLFFDPLAPSAAMNAREVARKILKLIPASGFSFSVVKVAGRLRLLQEFTSDRHAVGQAIDTATAVEASERQPDAALPETQLIATAQSGTNSQGVRTSLDERALAKVMLASLQESQRILLEQHVQPSLAGLLALARTQRALPGRKLVTYFTAGVQPDANANDMLHSIAGAANRSGVTFFVIDNTAIDTKVMEGLMQTMAMGAAAASNYQNPAPTGPAADKPAPYGPGLVTMAGNQMTRFETEGLAGNRDALTQLASSTGGAHIYAEDNLKKPFRQMVSDLTTYYEASYVPPTLNYDGEFHPVDVKSVRSGLKMRSRAGYFAVPPSGGIRPFEVPLMRLLTKQPLPEDLKFRAAILALGSLPDGNENELVVQVPAADLATQDDANSNLYFLHASIVAEIRNQAGEVIDHFGEDIPRHASLDARTSGHRQLITMQRHFIADPGTYTLEAAILDRISGKAGAQKIDFSISKSPVGPSLGDLAMVERLDPIPAGALDTEEPFRYGMNRVVPNLFEAVPHGTKQISFFFDVHPDAESAEQPRLEMQVLKSNETLTQAPLQLGKTTGPATLPYMASIQSSALGSGNYEVIETITQGGKVAQQSLSFTIEGPELASAAPEASAGTPNAEAAESVSGVYASHTEPGQTHPLLITTLPDTVPPPSSSELQQLIENARKRALEYARSLPNFICIESTDRSVDSSGNGNWKHRDSFAELLTYHDGQESRKTLELNGKRSTIQRTDLSSNWPLSVGEFGALLGLVFDPSSKTQFVWKEGASLSNGSAGLQVLKYRVARENATITIGQDTSSVGVGFHGLVFIESATGGVRRVTLEADDLPQGFTIHSATMDVDYDYVAIAGRDYLLPVRSSVTLQRHHKKLELNEIAFRGYRRFASRSTIKLVQ